MCICPSLLRFPSVSVFDNERKMKVRAPWFPVRTQGGSSPSLSPGASVVEMLTEAAVGAEMCLCWSNGGTKCSSVSLPSSLSSISAVPRSKPHQCVNSDAHTFFLLLESATHSSMYHISLRPRLQKPHPGPSPKTTALQVHVAQGQTMPHSLEWSKSLAIISQPCFLQL